MVAEMVEHWAGDERAVPRHEYREGVHRRVPLTPERARETARTLWAVMEGEHPLGSSPPAVRLASRKLAELLDEVGSVLS